MIVPSATVDEITDKIVTVLTPDRTDTRSRVMAALSHFEKEGLDVHRMSPWEKQQVVRHVLANWKVR